MLTPLVKSDDGISLLGYSVRYLLTGAVNDPQQVVDISTTPSLSAVIAARPTQAVTSQNAIALPSGTIAKLGGSSLRPIISLSDFYLEFSPKDIVALSNEALKVYSIGKLSVPAGRIVKPASGDALYIYGADRNLWALGSLSELWTINSWLGSGVSNARYEDMDVIGIKIYNGIVSVGGRYYVVTTDSLLHELPATAISSSDTIMPLSGPVTSRLKYSTTPGAFIRFDNGTIFNIQNGALHPLASMSAYYRLGGNVANTVSLPLKALPSFTVGSVTY